MSTEPFPLFGTTHLITLGILCLAGALIVCGSRFLPSDRHRTVFCACIGVFMFIQELIDRGLHYHEGERLANVLPFHLCGASVFLTVAMLITGSRVIFDLLYFWGLTGATMAILTPDIKYPFPHLLYITYFWSHALIVIGVLLMIALRGYRPTLRSLWRAVIITNVYMAVVAFVDVALDANYLFLCHKPEGVTLVDFLGSWPWYIAGLEIVGLICFFLVYSPYLVLDTWRARQSHRLT